MALPANLAIMEAEGADLYANSRPAPRRPEGVLR